MLAESPAEALPELEGDEREVVSEFLAAPEITRARERGAEEISPGDVAAAINGDRAVYDHLIASRATGEVERAPEEP
ncbi:MAG: hypothetical protein ACYDBR_07060 [Gaiellaceae bacterium]